MAAQGISIKDSSVSSNKLEHDVSNQTDILTETDQGEQFSDRPKLGVEMQPKYQNINPKTNYTTFGQNLSANATETSMRPYE
jgi:hypothetical protein